VIPRHEYDRAYVPIPDAPQASMLDLTQLPDDVQAALRTVREHEAQGAAWPTLLADPVRAWFRHEDRCTAALGEKERP
jgi:hypothetical protein